MPQTTKEKIPSGLKKKGAFLVERMYRDLYPIEEIAKETGWSPKRITNFLSSEEMLPRWNDYLTKRWFLHQIKKILFEEKLQTMLFEKVISGGDKITAKQAAAALRKMSKKKKQNLPPQIINPNSHNVIPGLEGNSSG